MLKQGEVGGIGIGVGMLEVLIAPQLAAIGAIAALLTEATIVIEKAEK